MLPRLLTIALAALLCITGCTPVRTVYDSQGNLVTEDDEPGGEKDLMSVYEKKFNNDFTVKKTEDGVPQTVSTKQSPFQRDLDNARNSKEQFATKSISFGKENEWRNKNYGGADKEFNTGREALGKKSNTMFSTDMRPDFMNETHGISRTDQYQGWRSRSSMEGKTMQTSTYYNNRHTTYADMEQDAYFELRRNKTEQPVIIDHREYYRRHKQGIRDLLGRDNESTNP